MADTDVDTATVQGMEDEPHTIEQRAMAAVALRAAGWDYGKIARFHGFANANAARNVVERALADLVQPEDIKRMRDLHRLRYDRLLRSVWPKAIDPDKLGHLDYFRAAMAVMDRQATLDGLNAPTQHEIITPDQRSVIEWVTDMVKRAGYSASAEADIIDVEIEQAMPDDDD